MYQIKPARTLIAALMLLAVATGGYTQDGELPSGEEIADRINARDDGEFLTRDMKITMKDKSGKTREQLTHTYRRYYGKEKRAVIFYVDPANVKDTGFLTYDYPDSGKEDDQWLYLPALRRVRRISSSNRGDYYLGTDLTYEDIKLDTRISREFDWITLGMGDVKGTKCYHIEGTPKSKEIAEELGVGGAEDALREVEHEGLVLLGHAVDVHDHPQGVRLGDVDGEVALAAQVAHLLDVLVGDVVDAVLAGADGGGLEPVVGHLAVVAVDGAVELHERGGRREPRCLHVEVVLVRAEHHVVGVEPVPVVAGDGEHVGVPGECPEGLVPLGLAAQDRRVATQPGGLGVPGVHVGPAQGVVEEGGVLGRGLRRRRAHGNDCIQRATGARPAPVASPQCHSGRCPGAWLVACLSFVDHTVSAGSRARRTGRRGLIGAWLRPH